MIEPAHYRLFFFSSQFYTSPVFLQFFIPINTSNLNGVHRLQATTDALVGRAETRGRGNARSVLNAVPRCQRSEAFVLLVDLQINPLG